MTRATTTLPDFFGGEISPRMYGRHDLAVYYNGGRRIENFTPQAQGGARFRTGTVYAAKTYNNQKARLATFEISNSLSFGLEITAGRIRFYRNGGQVRETAQSITGVTQANPAVVTYSGDDNYSNGDSIIIEGVSGMTELNGNEYTVANVNTGSNTFELSGVDSSSYTAYSSGGEVSVITEVTNPYAADELFDLDFAQDNVDLYIAHPNHNPKKLTFTSATSWALADHEAVSKVYDEEIQVITAITQANPAVVTYVSGGGDNLSNGDTVRIRSVKGMTELNNNEYTVANVNAGADTFELSGVDSTSFNAYIEDGSVDKVIVGDVPFREVDKYPGAVTFYEDRLIYGGSNDRPQTLYFSRSADPDDFSVGTEVDDGIDYSVSGEGNSIQWLRGTNQFLAIGTFGDVLQATGGLDQVITPTSISIKPANAFGVADIDPVGRGSQIYYVQRNQLVIRSFEYDFEQNSYRPVNRNLVADHITSSGITQMTFQEGLPNILWCVRTDGVLAGLCIEDTEGLSGWHRLVTDGVIASVAAVPRNISYDELWMCVERDGNYYMEYQTDEAIHVRRSDYINGTESSDDSLFQNLSFERQKEYIHVDSSLTYDGSGVGLTASAAITPASIGGTGVTFTASASVFSANDVGRHIWRKSVTGVEIGRAEITAYTSGTEVICDVLEGFDSVDQIPAGEWYLTANAVTGLDHLEGKEVTIIADGAQHDKRTVTNGSVSLQREVSVAHIGLGYTGYLETNNLESGGVNGAAQNKRMSLTAIGIRFLDSLFAKYGEGYYNLEDISFRRASMKMDRPPTLFSGDQKVQVTNKVSDEVSGGWQRGKRVIIVQEQPFPCNVQMIVPYTTTSNV